LPKIFDYDAVFEDKAFWVVAALLDSVLARGLKQIYTRMPSKYYEYVFSCKDFNRLVSYGDQIKDWSHGRWVALLGGKDPLAGEALAVLEDEQPAIREVDDDGDVIEYVPVLPPQIPSELRPTRSQLSVSRPAIEWTDPNGDPHKALFDGCSHDSGMQRAYVNCVEHGSEGCVKYRFVHSFPTARDCIVWLFAWRLDAASSLDRVSHVDAEPTHETLSYVSLHCPDVPDT
jgi:hypothetical protein